MSNLAQTIERELAQAAEKDQLDLPTLPEVALRIRDTASNRTSQVQHLRA